MMNQIDKMRIDSVISQFRALAKDVQVSLLRTLSEPHVETLFGVPDDVQLFVHESAEHIHRTYWEKLAIVNQFTFEEIMACKRIGVVAIDGVDEPVELSIEDELAALKKLGMWGFADYVTDTVHLWVSEGYRRDPASQNAIRTMVSEQIVELMPFRYDDENQQSLKAAALGQVQYLSTQVYDRLVHPTL